MDIFLGTHFLTISIKICVLHSLHLYTFSGVLSGLIKAPEHIGQCFIVVHFYLIL